MRVAQGSGPSAIPGVPVHGRLTVLFDADCGFCSRTAEVLRRLDRRRALELVAVQRAHLVLPDAPPEARLLETIHVRDGGASWATGGAAWVQVAAAVPWLRPLSLVAKLPLFDRLVEPAYRLVARNRHLLGRAVGADACRFRTPSS
jgi:predicted DCC family thiol-disulfide oxidoreductase YuxK